LLNNKLAKINGLKYKNNSISDTNIITKLPDWVEVKGYKFDILEDGSVEKRADYETLKSMYGTVVNGYNAGKDLDATKKVDSWKLLYVDEENGDAILISSNALPKPQPTANGIPFESSNGIAYTGSANVASFEYGKNYNDMWLEYCSIDIQTNTAKATAYLCDPSNFEQYKDGKARYAAGGPTIEIIMGSVFEKGVNNTSEYFQNINSTGYQKKNVLTTNMQLSDIKRELYYTNGTYWVASPNGSHEGRALYFDKDYSLLINANSTPASKNIGIRPIVCLPASAIKIDGENLSV